MKTIKLILLTGILLCAYISYGQVNTTIKPSGKWRHTNSWSLNRIPLPGDTIVIAPGTIIQIDNNQNLSSASTFIQVFGTIELQEDGRLNLHPNSHIILLPGAQVRSDGDAENEDHISIGGVRKFRGNNGPVIGPAYANSSTPSAPNGFVSGTLPVKFTSFSASRQGKDILVQWTTAEESNSSHYEIERCVDGRNWVKVGSVQAAGNSHVQKSYTYSDKHAPETICQYRLRQVDLDGKFVYTTIYVVKAADAATDITIRSAPGKIVYVNFSKQVKETVVLNFYNSQGQLISQTRVTNPVGQIQVPVNINARGIYVVKIMGNSFKEVAGQVFF